MDHWCAGPGIAVHHAVQPGAQQPVRRSCLRRMARRQSAGICPHLRAIKWISDPACTSCHDAGPDQGRRHCLCDCGHRDHRDRDALPGPPGCPRLASQHGNRRAAHPIDGRRRHSVLASVGIEPRRNRRTARCYVVGGNGNWTPWNSGLTEFGTGARDEPPLPGRAAAPRLGNNEWFWRLNEYTYGVNHLFLGSHGLTAVGALTAFAAWWLLLLYGPIRLTNRWLWALVSAGLLITAVGYIGSLYLTYLFAFAERGPLLPSYTRYVNAVVISMLFVSFAPLLPGFRSNSERTVWTVGRLSITASATLFLQALRGSIFTRDQRQDESRCPIHHLN